MPRYSGDLTSAAVDSVAMFVKPVSFYTKKYSRKDERCHVECDHLPLECCSLLFRGKFGFPFLLSICHFQRAEKCVCPRTALNQGKVGIVSVAVGVDGSNICRKRVQSCPIYII